MAEPIKTYRSSYTGQQIDSAVGVAHDKIQ